MIFEDRSVVVEEGQVRSRVDVEVVRSPGVVEVVDHGGHQRSENLEVGNPILKKIKKPFFSFFVGHWSRSADKLSFHFIHFSHEEGFYKPKFLKIHSQDYSICYSARLKFPTNLLSMLWSKWMVHEKWFFGWVRIWTWVLSDKSSALDTRPWLLALKIHETLINNWMKHFQESTVNRHWN